MDALLLKQFDEQVEDQVKKIRNEGEKSVRIMRSTLKDFLESVPGEILNMKVKEF